MICTAHRILLGGQIEKNEMGGACSTCGGEERRIQDLVGKTEGSRPLGRPGGGGIDGRIILKWIFRKWDVGVWAGLSWLRIGTGDG